MPMLTTTQAAKLKGVSTARVRQWVLSGRLKATKFGRDLMIDKADLATIKPLPGGRPKREPTPDDIRFAALEEAGKKRIAAKKEATCENSSA